MPNDPKPDPRVEMAARIMRWDGVLSDSDRWAFLCADAPNIAEMWRMRARIVLATTDAMQADAVTAALLDEHGAAKPELVKVAEDMWDAGASMSRCLGAAIRAAIKDHPHD